MTGQKHPLRCETCGNRKGHYDIPFCDYWDKKIPITKYGMDLIAHIGCASHSDARSADDVLDVQLLKDSIIEALDTGFESSERDMEIVIDRINVWQKGELRKGGRE